MKKVLTIFIALIVTISALSLAACGKGGNGGSGGSADSACIGSWKAISANAFGEEVLVEDVFTEGFFVTFKEDGTADIYADGESESGKWTESGEEITVKGSDANMTFKLKDGVLTADLLGVTFTFERDE